MNWLSKAFPLGSPDLQWEGSEYQLNLEDDDGFAGCFLAKDGLSHADELLFQAAISACHESKTVIYVCAQPMTSLPLSIHGMPKPGPDIMAHLTFVYLKDMGELVNYLAKLHLNPCADVLLISNLAQYVSSQGDCSEQNIARLCAIINDAANFMYENRKGAVVTSVYDASDAHRSLYRRILSPCYLVNSDGISGSFHVIYTDKATHKSIKICTYTHDRHLFMRDIKQTFIS